jgi:predicted GNAT family N-acyltransferase
VSEKFGDVESVKDSIGETASITGQFLASSRHKTPIDLPFEPGTYDGDGSFVFVRNPSPDELRLTYDMAVAEIGTNVATFGTVQSVYAHNAMAWWSILRATDETRRDARLVGFLSTLPLNEAGLTALRQGTFDAHSPALSHMAPAGENPCALYLWAIVAPGLSDLAGKLLAHAVGLDLYESIPMFGRIGTQAGLDALRRSSKSQPDADLKLGSPFEIRLPPKHLDAQRALRIYQGRRIQFPYPQLETLVAATPDHIAKVFAIRAAVFMSEQQCPYEEEYDGNDYSGTHILGLVNGEPAAVLRIRYFADFVKIERLAVLARFRGSRIAQMTVEHAIAIVRRKGYRTMYGHAQKRLVQFWGRFGFEPMAKNTELVFSDHEYVEVVASLAPHEDRLTIHSDPYTLIRPEGRWDEPGTLDRSAARAATNPY